MDIIIIIILTANVSCNIKPVWGVSFSGCDARAAKRFWWTMMFVQRHHHLSIVSEKKECVCADIWPDYRLSVCEALVEIGGKTAIIPPPPPHVPANQTPWPKDASSRSRKKANEKDSKYTTCARSIVYLVPLPSHEKWCHRGTVSDM